MSTESITLSEGVGQVERSPSRRSARLPLSGAMWPAESIKINLQVIASPGGDVLWVSGALPGAVHDKNAEWIWGVLTELEAAGLVTLADKGYQGSAYAKIPYRGKNKPESQKEANHAHARLRAPGERANGQLKTWKILRKLRCCPWRAGQLAKAVHVLQTRET